MRDRGFTLIELLVVVAIIAILAAIALPNFLEAQTRAKVSRAKADIRTVVTALEAYRVDWNGYPTYHYTQADGFVETQQEFHLGGRVVSIGQPDTTFDGRNPLTSPVAYMTTSPMDPFAKHRGAGDQELREYLYVNWPYAVRKAEGTPQESVFQDVYDAYGAYRLHSRGPDLDGPDSGMPYDPTNGQLSDGDITYGPNTGFNTYIPFSFRPDTP